MSCETCHSVSAWSGARFDHDLSRFRLTGAHVSVDCVSCHVGGKYTGTPVECGACHMALYQATKNPNHPAAKFSTDCAICHTTAAWTGVQFDHSTTGFSLTGIHAKTACAQCHVNDRYAGLPSTCDSCHSADHLKATNPNHANAGFPKNCEMCHTPNGWSPADFDHNLTKFPLTGKNASTECASCHIGGKYTGTVAVCSGCHLTDFQKTTNPNHTTAGFLTTCDTCHNRRMEPG